MPFFVYYQNATEGKIITDDRWARYLIIEAPDATEANLILRLHGIQPDAHECQCCDPRWTSYELGYEGDLYPSLYGYRVTFSRNPAFYNSGLKAGETLAYIYYLNGKKDTIRQPFTTGER